MEQCEECGFAWDTPTPKEVAARLRAVARDVHPILEPVGGWIGDRPEPDVWSVREYACHVRDALLNLRDRIVLGVAEDNPTPFPMFASVRLEIGLYQHGDSASLAREIDVAATLMADLIDTLDADQLARPIFYPWPRAATRTLAWVGAQGLHEAEHHLDDIRRAAATREPSDT